MAAWRALQNDWYNLIFQKRERVYNQELGIPKRDAPEYITDISRTGVENGAFSGYVQYLSVPVVWRNYYDMVGFHRNKSTGELWLEPIIPDEMNHIMTDALVFTPEGWATVSCTESDPLFQTQEIIFKPDSAMPVKTLYLTDKGISNPYIWINDSLVPQSNIVKIGKSYGFAKEYKIDLNDTITSSGLKIRISKNASLGKTNNSNPLQFAIKQTRSSVSITAISKNAHEITLYSINGKILQKINGVGTKQYSFGTKASQAVISLNSGIYILQMRSGNDYFSRQFIISR